MVGERLKCLREKAGLNVAQLSRISGVPYPTIRGIEEEGRDPRGDTLVALARALSCPVGELLGEEAPADGASMPVELALLWKALTEKDKDEVRGDMIRRALRERSFSFADELAPAEALAAV